MAAVAALKRAPLIFGVTLLAAAVITGLRLHFSLTAWIAVVVTSAAAGAVASRLFPLPYAGIASAGVFASMPLIVRNAESLPALMLLIILGWLAAIDQFQRTGHRWWLLAGAALLGAGVATGANAFVMLPLLAIATAAALLLIDDPLRVAPRVLLLAGGVAILAALPFAVYLVTHPEWFATRAMAYGLYDSTRFNPLQGAREVTSWVGLTARSEAYWHYLDPSFLFLSGSVLFVPTIFVLPIGVARAAFEPHRVVTLLLIGLCVAPLPAAVLAQGPFASRFTPAAPFATMLVIAGLHSLWSDARPWRQFAAVMVAAAVVISAIAFALTPSLS